MPTGSRVTSHVNFGIERKRVQMFISSTRECIRVYDLLYMFVRISLVVDVKFLSFPQILQLL